MIKSVLVTGGAGYIGTILVPKLIQNNYRVKVVDWYIFATHPLPRLKNSSYLTQIKGDIRDTKLMQQALKNIDAVIHLASIANDPTFDLNPQLAKSINYDATIQLANLAKQAGVERFIFASTSSVYGVKTENNVTEDLILEPLTDYSKYKALSEKYLLTQNDRNFFVLIIRPATVCGYSPRLRLDLTVNLLTLQALVNHTITVYGGTQYRPNIHIADLTDLYLKSLEFPGHKIAGKIYNAGYENLTLAEVAKLIQRTIHYQHIAIVTTPTNDARSYRISSTKIKADLGFIPKHSVKDAILDLQHAYDSGHIPNALDDPIYYNIRTLKQQKPTYVNLI